MKTCSVCGQAKPHDEFPYASTKKGSRRADCKACHNDLNRTVHEHRQAFHKVPFGSWREHAACTHEDPALFIHHPREFRDPSEVNYFDYGPALAVCARCPVTKECLAYAMAFPVSDDYGVWGGTTKQDRERIRYPHLEKCSIASCDNRAKAAGLCRGHYQRRAYAGDPLADYALNTFRRCLLELEAADQWLTTTELAELVGGSVDTVDREMWRAKKQLFVITETPPKGHSRVWRLAPGVTADSLPLKARVSA